MQKCISSSACPGLQIKDKSFVMCRRFKLLANIETTSVEDLKSFLIRSAKLYVLLTILSIVYVILLVNGGSTPLLALAVIAAVLYAGCSVSLYFTGKNGTDTECIFSLIGTVLLLALKVASAAYSIYIGNYTSIIQSIVSIAIQTSTVYLIFKLRQKLLSDTPSAPFLSDSKV